MMIRRNFLAAAIALPFMAQARAETGAAPAPAAAAAKRVLLIGIDPKLVDFTNLPGLDADKLGAIVEGQKEQLVTLGYSAEWCFIDAGPTAQRKVVDLLRQAQFDVISIGAGIRLPPENMLLFERIVNAVHHHAPQARICFSKTANDTVEAVERWVKPA